MQVTHRMEVSAEVVDNTFTFSALADGRVLLTVDTLRQLGLRDRKSFFLTKEALALLGTTAHFFLENADKFKLDSLEEAML